jgi:hypothetical protein
MKSWNYVIGVMVLLIMNIGCAPQENEAIAELQKEDLIGTWRLIKTIEIGHEDSTNRRDGVEKFYIKHVNDTHFIWVEYDRKKNMLLGTGGGTYTLKDNIYTEDIRFYYPPGSNEMGQAIPFKAEINNDGIWHHTGYAKLMEFDPETAESVMVDTAIIDELWERVDITPKDDSSGKLLGSWEIVNYLEQVDSTYSEYPSFYGIFKLMTPTHFTWVHYNTEADEIFALGGGPYSVVGDQYIELIEYIHPQEDSKIGVNAVYTWSQEDENRWNIQGVVEDKDYPEAREENWHRFGSDGVEKSPEMSSN